MVSLAHYSVVSTFCVAAWPKPHSVGDRQMFCSACQGQPAPKIKENCLVLDPVLQYFVNGLTEREKLNQR